MKPWLVFPKHFADRIRSNTGSVYVVQKSGFTVHEPWQYKSYNPVVAEITVTLQDYFDFGGKLEFIEADGVESV